MSLRPNPGILEITPYVGGRASAHGVAEPVKLSSNESALGPSKAAIAAFREAAGMLEFYPEGGASILRDAIAKTYGLDPARIVCGNG